uniref:Uncharacterized protein n=1 Tax=Glossina pallidipes TaxID=7398 RepID=A0A1A9ZIS8_GLOPL
MLQKHVLCTYMKAYHKIYASVKGTFDRYQRLHKVKHSWGVKSSINGSTKFFLNTGRFLIHFTVGVSEPIKDFLNATTFLLIFVSSSCVHSELLAFYNFSVCIGLVFSQFPYAEWRYTHFGTPSKHLVTFQHRQTTTKAATLLATTTKIKNNSSRNKRFVCSMKASPKCAAYFKRMYRTTITITTTTTTATTATTTITTK